MVTVEYDPIEGYPLRDGDVETTAQWIIEDSIFGTQHYAYGTENIFFALRCAISNGRLNCNDIKYRELEFHANHYGAINPWPSGFCGLLADYATRIGVNANNQRNFERIEKENRP